MASIFSNYFKICAAENESEVEEQCEGQEDEVEVEETETNETEADDGEPENSEEDEEDEVDVEDPQLNLKEECASSCSKYQRELDTCTERVSSRSNTSETCEQELYDFLHCRDAKVAVSLFKHLK